MVGANPAYRLRRALHCVAVALLCLVLAQPVPTPAQLAVFDASVFGQAVLDVAYTLQLVQLTLQDLVPLTQIGTALSLVAEMQSLMSQVDGIAQQMAGRQAIWSSNPMIETPSALAAFRSSANALCSTVRQGALTAQLLVARVVRLLSTVIVMLESLQTLVGTLGGLQAASIKLGALAGQMAGLQTMIATSNEARLCLDWQMGIRERSVVTIQQYLLRDYGQARTP